MINNMDVLAFFISMIIAVVVTIWIASGNNKVESYGVGENDPPETNPPRLPGVSKISYKNVDFNELGIPMLKPGTMPMPEVKPPKEDKIQMRDNTIPPYMDYDIKPSKEEIEKQAMKNLEDFKKVKSKIDYACSEAGITMEQALKFMDAFNEV